MKKDSIAIDLGTTNTVVARWNGELDGPEIIHLEGICRGQSRHREIDDSFTIPSCVYLVPPGDALSFPFKYLFKNLRGKTRGIIGREGQTRDGGLYRPNFVDRFKAHLGRTSFQSVGTLGTWSFTAEEVTRIFLKALFAAYRRIMNRGIGGVTFCVPVDYYEFYRARLQRIAGHIGAGRLRTIDEPVAAALGYGLTLDDSRTILVIDFGGGTLHAALIAAGDKTSDTGQCRVIAKEGLPVGGGSVDAWLVEEICGHYGYEFDRISTDPDIAWWYRILLAEACRVKEALFFSTADTFYLLPSPVVADYAARVPGDREALRRPREITRDDLVSLLTKRGLYRILDGLIDGILETAATRGIAERDIQDVLLVGGSTLLPGIYPLVEKRFGRGRVRAWQPFNAVAFGAAAFAAGRVAKADYITHDYAFITYDRASHEPQHNIIIPRGTAYPTPRDFWKRQLVPTCALGEPERIFKLVICEIGRRHTHNQEFLWDEKGDVHLMEAGSPSPTLVVPLNESDPTLGFLDPPHEPGDPRARIELSFMVNEERWLCATVYDLKTQRPLMEEKPVIRLK